jgi:microcystin-dependent protein
MGKVHHRGERGNNKKNRRRGKRPCISAPSTPTNVDLKFRKVERNRTKRWNGRVKWDAVTTDVGGRTLPTNTDGNARADGYQIQLQACDPSGDPVELGLQEDSADQYGTNWSDTSGASTVLKTYERRLNATGNIITSTNLTGLTAGIEVVVQFFAHLDTAGSATVKFEVWNVTAGSSVISKQTTVTDSHLPKLQAKMKFTPAGGTNYAMRVTWVSGSNKPVLTKGEWHDTGDTALWRKRADDEDTSILFKELARPKVWYYQARVRARSNHQGHRCWSAWSGWTSPTNPVTGDETGPAAPDGLALTFDRTDNKRKAPFRAKVVWNEVGWWIPPDGDAQEGAKEYGVKLATSEDGGASTLTVRHQHMLARDADADTTASSEFRHIKRARSYRAAVRARDHEGNWGAWSAWTAWRSPTTDIGAGPNNPLNVVTTKTKPGHLLTVWDEPTTPEDVDRFRVRVYNLGNLRETVYTRSHHHKYVVPNADRGTAHRVKVTAIDEDGNLSTEVDQGSDTSDDAETAEPWEVGDIRHIPHTSVANWLTSHPRWLKCDGTGYATATYPDLFAAIGYTYGGSGATFNVPDIRGRHPIGVGTNFAVGGNDGVAESSRTSGHTHSTDGTSVGVTGDATDTTPTTDTTGEASHGHFVSNFQSDGPGATVPRGSAASDAAGPSHGHNIPSHNTNSGANHQHGHSHFTHNHNHGHGSHGHSHAHDNKVRPHQAVHFVIKALP